MAKLLEGVFPILATPFTGEGKIDLESQLRLVDHLLAQGAHGLGLFGNAGEGYTLLNGERRELQRAIVKRVDGRVPVVVGVGATGADAAVELCREAEDLGADALMVLPPYYLRPDGNGLMVYFSMISDAVNVPVMVQDAPALSQVSMPAALLARMAQQIERVEYAKIEAAPTAPKVTQTLNAANGALTAFGGLNGQFLIEEIERGARGTMPASDLTSRYIEIWNALESSDRDRAWRVFVRALPLIRFELQPGLGVSAIKHNLKACGVIRSARVRHPTSELEPEGLRELAHLRALVGYSE